MGNTTTLDNETKRAITQPNILRPENFNIKAFRAYLEYHKTVQPNNPWVRTMNPPAWLGQFLHRELGFVARFESDGVYTWRGGYQCGIPFWVHLFKKEHDLRMEKTPGMWGEDHALAILDAIEPLIDNPYLVVSALAA